MIVVSHYEGRKVGVLGLGRSGLAVVRSLVAGKADVYAWDDDKTQHESAVQCGATIHSLQDVAWDTFAALIVSPGVPLTHPVPHPLVRAAREAGVAILGDMALFQQAVRVCDPTAMIVAVTGTNGKSTTTALIGHLLKNCGRRVEVGGNIGTPVLELHPPSGNTVYVLEVSSYQINLAPGLRPDIGVLLNISPDHIERHGTLENYVAIKARLFEHQTGEDRAVIGVDDALTSGICTRIGAQHNQALVRVCVGKVLGRGVHVLDGVLYDNTGVQSITVGDLKALTTLAGAHNWQNAAMAYAVGRILQLSREELYQALKTFGGLAHRMEIVAEEAGVVFINDSKATNAHATAHALAVFECVYWIAGGRAKDGGITTLTDYFSRIRKAYLIGEAAAVFAPVLGEQVAYEISGTLPVAVTSAIRDVRKSRPGKGTAVLLSPACASFDQFRDFEARGECFRRGVLSGLGQGGGVA